MTSYIGQRHSDRGDVGALEMHAFAVDLIDPIALPNLAKPGAALATIGDVAVFGADANVHVDKMRRAER